MLIIASLFIQNSSNIPIAFLNNLVYDKINCIQYTQSGLPTHEKVQRSPTEGKHPSPFPTKGEIKAETIFDRKTVDCNMYSVGLIPPIYGILRCFDRNVAKEYTPGLCDGSLLPYDVPENRQKAVKGAVYCNVSCGNRICAIFSPRF